MLGYNVNLFLNYGVLLASSPHFHTPLRSTLILYYELYSGSQGGVYLSDFPNVNAHVSMFFPQFVLHSLPAPYFSICLLYGRNNDADAKVSRNATIRSKQTGNYKHHLLCDLQFLHLRILTIFMLSHTIFTTNTDNLSKLHYARIA
jgi:hypothetical protein